MAKKFVVMIHVPDVRATVKWYESIGFTLIRVNEDDGEMAWALLTFGESELMFSEGGRVGVENRRDVDLYVHTDDVDGIHQNLGNRVDVVEEPHDTFYGMREFIIRDLNGFWITFGQSTANG